MINRVTLLALALAAAVFVSGCTTSTAFGKCVGVMDDARDPSKIYNISVLNMVLAIVFVETIIVPVVVVANEFQCPVGNK